MRDGQLECLQLNCSVDVVGDPCDSMAFWGMESEQTELPAHFSIDLDIPYGEVVVHSFDAAGFTYRLTVERIHFECNIVNGYTIMQDEVEWPVLGWGVESTAPAEHLSPLKDISLPK